MSEQDDKALDNYLAGVSALSAQYRRARGDGPPESLDRAVLEQARRALADDGRSASQWSRRPGWLVPVSTAAVVVLAAALVLDVSLAPQSGPPLVAPETVERAAPSKRVNDALLDSSQHHETLRARRESPAVGGRDDGTPARGAAHEPEPIPYIAPQSAAESASMAKSSDLERIRSAPPPRNPASRSAAAEPGSDHTERLEAELGSAPMPASRGMAAPEAGQDDARRIIGHLEPSAERAFAADSAAAEGALRQRDAQQLYFQRIQWLLAEQRPSDAQDLLDEMIHRWPDLELPAGFPLDDPRTQDPPAAPP